MRKSILYTVFCFAVFCNTCLLAQEVNTDTSRLLNEFVVTASRLSSFSSGIKIHRLDSALLREYSAGTLGDVLQNESTLFVKNYGPSSLSTTSFRGGSAAHTAVLWNGFNINSPMNGQVDFTLLPNDFSDRVYIQYGGGSTLWGSGAVSGTVHIDNEEKYNDGIKANAVFSMGSFGLSSQNASFSMSGKRWVSRMNLLHRWAENDFTFYNTTQKEQPLQTQTHAETKLQGILSENYFLISDKQKVNFFFWLQDNQRNIPPVMTQTESASSQNDITLRLSSQWNYSGNKANYFLRTAFFRERLDYNDSLNGIFSSGLSTIVIAEAEARYPVGENHLLNAGINNTFANAETEGYNGPRTQNRFAAFLSWKFSPPGKKFNSGFSVRQEITDGQRIPFTFSGGIEYRLAKWIKANANASRVYRVPTLNDQYWIPGGNTALLPESGYSAEGGLQAEWKTGNEKIIIRFEPTLFTRNISNWIIWLPDNGYWSPQNIMQVWSRGAETRTEVAVALKKIKFRTELLTNYVVSTSEKAKTANDNSVDKQLIYVPMYSGRVKFTVQYADFSFSYQHSYTGYRYTSTDNTQFLKPYLAANGYAAYTNQVKKYKTDFFIRVSNIFSESYQVVSNRPMPLIHYQAGISIQFHHKNNIK